MGHHSVILFFGILSFMGWYASIFPTKRTIIKIGFHKKYYPKRYIMPNRKMRKLYGLKKREIPKWLYTELFMSFVYVGFFVIFTVMYFLLSDKMFVLQLSIWSYGITMCVDMLRIIVCLCMYR